MIPQPQTRKHPNGDCLRACISSLLEISIEKVPDFMLLADIESTLDIPAWFVRMQDYLHDFHGLQLIEIPLRDRVWFPVQYPTFVILFGIHKTGCKHAIVGKCWNYDFAPVFDPIAEDSDELPFRDGLIESIGMLVPVDPSRTAQSRLSLESIEKITAALPNGPVKAAILKEIECGLGRVSIPTPLIFDPNEINGKRI